MLCKCWFLLRFKMLNKRRLKFLSHISYKDWRTVRAVRDVIVNHWARKVWLTTSHTSCPQETAPAHLCPTRSPAQQRHHSQIQLEKLLSSCVVRKIQRNNNNCNWSHFFVRYNAVLKADYICCWKLISLFYLIFIKQLLTMITERMWRLVSISFTLFCPITGKYGG